MKSKLNFSKFAIFTSIGLILFIISFQLYDKKIASGSRIVDSTSMPRNQQNDILQDSIVDYGMEFLGTPYVAAGCGVDGFDCSGFVFFVFQHFKIDVPRSSAGFENYGHEIPIADIQKGDLLLFLSPTRDVIGHVGIATDAKGKESSFIHASSGKDMKVIISKLSSPGYEKRFVKAVRAL